MNGGGMSNHLDKIAFDFFKLFAQYEFALKAMNYFRPARELAEPDWDRFSNEIGVLIMTDNDPEVSEARNYLLVNPPKKQIIKDGAVAWGEVPNQDKSPQALYSHIRRVRNNLYHGGKFNGVWFDPDRSEALINHSLVILRALKSKRQDLANAIEGNHA